MSKAARISPAEFTRLCRQERERLSALRLQLIESHPFWGYLLLQMQLVFQADLPALAATDCMRHIWFNPVLTSRLPIRQLGFVMVHEICHSVFASMERRGSRNPHLWNCATDYAINRIVSEIRGPGAFRARSLYDIPEIYVDGREQKILLDPKYDGMIAETIYEALAADELQNPSLLVLRLNLPGSEGEGTGGQTLELPDVADHGGGIDVHVPLPLSPAQREELADRIRGALATWQNMGRRGDVPMAEVCQLLPGRRSRVPWPRLLRQFAGQALARDDYSLVRPNKRYLSEKIVVPGLFSESLNLVVVALDTSGSMDTDLLSQAIAEIARLSDLAPEVLLITADAAVHQVVPAVRLPSFLRELKVKGGGGTSHIPVFAHIDEQHLEPDLFIGITDLETLFPKKRPRYPVLWLAPAQHSTPPWGCVVEIDP
mgnify:FL=1